ncbi:hypothetical protein BDV25DRAFT_151380 [Aspergillus avenaceus]|uniref:Uncharacterized protein n=1 Tax=Aspergillus avenaceus TaxID=36643 RepID=A0A5N6U0R6_ASPAV|nr:hypothetical protein BDV25DRAFT_151380 [Aspergillus avenaceus]
MADSSEQLAAVKHRLSMDWVGFKWIPATVVLDVNPVHAVLSSRHRSISSEDRLPCNGPLTKIVFHVVRICVQFIVSKENHSESSQVFWAFSDPRIVRGS